MQARLPDKQIMVGGSDLSDMKVETPEVVEARIRRVLPCVAKGRGIRAPDCGMTCLPREVAVGKLQSMVEAARMRRREHAAGRGNRQPQPGDSDMHLTREQIAAFDRDGDLFFPGHFSAAEIALLQAESPALYARREADNVRDRGSDAALIAQLVEHAGGRGGFDGAGRYDPGGIVSPKGPAGPMIVFHSCLVHASTSNLSPWNRVGVYLSLCAVSNHIRRFKRPEYIAHRQFDAIECLADDCLLAQAPVTLPWAKGMPGSALETLETSPDPLQ